MHREACMRCGGQRTRGLLCDACAQPLLADDLCPEQIRSRGTITDGDNNAWLIDGFGVPHALVVPSQASVQANPVQALHRGCSVGRDPTSDVAIAERTVSHAHATIEHRPLSNAWFVVDAGSDNGVFVNGDRVPRRFPLEAGDVISLGRRVSFVFFPIDADATAWARSAQAWFVRQQWSEDTVGDSGDGASGVVVHISAATEGGAVASWGNARVSLSELEYELLATLHKHHEADVDVAASARGFVPAAQLLETLSFRSEAPTHANLRGLVRKVRRKLADRDDAVDVIESRQGLGYRVARSVVLD